MLVHTYIHTYTHTCNNRRNSGWNFWDDGKRVTKSSLITSNWEPHQYLHITWECFSPRLRRGICNKSINRRSMEAKKRNQSIEFIGVYYWVYWRRATGTGMHQPQPNEQYVTVCFPHYYRQFRVFTKQIMPLVKHHNLLVLHNLIVLHVTP